MTYEFKHTNKQYFLRGCVGFFMIVGGIASVFILINIVDFWETHAFETTLFLIMLVVVGSSMLKGLNRKEIKKNARLSSNSFIADNQRFPLDSLELYEFKSDDYNAFLLTHDKYKIALYTNQRDDLIKKLQTSSVKKHTKAISDYKFERNSATAYIMFDGKNEFSFNLNTGRYSFYDAESGEKPKTYNPEKFIQTPAYKLMRS